MKRRYARLLAALSAALMVTMLDITCTTGDPPDDGDHCWFFCKGTEQPQTTDASYTCLTSTRAHASNPA